MDEYIKRKAALEECDWYANEFCECEYAIMPLKGALENLPAADVRPVKPTVASIPRWIPVTDKEHIPNTDHGIVGYFGGGAFDQLRWYDFVTTLSDGTIVGECTERDVMNEHCIAVYKLPPVPKEET